MIEGQMKVYLHTKHKKYTRMDWKEKCFSNKMNHILTCEGQNISVFPFGQNMLVSSVMNI